MNPSETIDVNYLYFIHYIKQIPEWQSLKVLDFGCGKGEVVNLLRQEGIDCYGAEVFYAGGCYEDVYKSELFQQGIIRAISESGEIPFDDEHFDVIISNQVFEHVQDIDAAFSSIKRVLKDKGLMYHHFPSKEVIREGHIGIPFAHWLPKGKFRYYYTILLRSIGFGTFKDERSVIEWTQQSLDWIDNYCFYRQYKELSNHFKKEYIMAHREIDYCRFRAKSNKLLNLLLSFRFMEKLYQYLFRRLAFMAIELRKQNNHAAIKKVEAVQT